MWVTIFKALLTEAINVVQTHPELLQGLISEGLTAATNALKNHNAKSISTT